MKKNISDRTTHSLSTNTLSSKLYRHIPYSIISCYMSSVHITRSRKSITSLEFYSDTPLITLADKIKYARISCGKLQHDLADHLQIDRITYIRYENGQVSEQNIKVATLKQIATYCGQAYDFCFSPYHYFIDRDAGLQIKEYRRSHNLTSSQLGLMLGVTAKTVRYWEQGICNPSITCFELVSSNCDRGTS